MISTFFDLQQKQGRSRSRTSQPKPPPAGREALTVEQVREDLLTMIATAPLAEVNGLNDAGPALQYVSRLLPAEEVVLGVSYARINQGPRRAHGVVLLTDTRVLFAIDQQLLAYRFDKIGGIYTTDNPSDRDPLCHLLEIRYVKEGETGYLLLRVGLDENWSSDFLDLMQLEMDRHQLD